MAIKFFFLRPFLKISTHFARFSSFSHIFTQISTHNDRLNSEPNQWYVYQWVLLCLNRRDVTFMSGIPILKGYEMTFPTTPLLQKSNNPLQIFRHNEVSAEIYLLQLIMSITLQCVNGFLWKWACWKGNFVGFHIDSDIKQQKEEKVGCSYNWPIVNIQFNQNYHLSFQAILPQILFNFDKIIVGWFNQNHYLYSSFLHWLNF
jgi:hypothetical protein